MAKITVQYLFREGNGLSYKMRKNTSVVNEKNWMYLLPVDEWPTEKVKQKI